MTEFMSCRAAGYYHIDGVPQSAVLLARAMHGGCLATAATAATAAADLSAATPAATHSSSASAVPSSVAHSRADAVSQSRRAGVGCGTAATPAPGSQSPSADSVCVRSKRIIIAAVMTMALVLAWGRNRNLRQNELR